MAKTSNQGIQKISGKKGLELYRKVKSEGLQINGTLLMIKTTIPHQVDIGARIEERIPQKHLSVGGEASEAMVETEDKNTEMRVKSQDTSIKARVQKGSQRPG